MIKKHEAGWDRISKLKEQPDRKYGLDGLSRTQKEEQEINGLIAGLFSGPDGAAVIDYLRSITIERVCGPAIDDCALRHLEGQRYLVGLIEQRINLGRQGE